MQPPAASCSPLTAPPPAVDAPRSPSAPDEPTEQPVQAQAPLPGAPNPEETPESTSTPAPSLALPGGSVRPLRWLGYWAGGGDITDLSQGHNVTTVHAALAYYAGVDLLGIL